MIDNLARTELSVDATIVVKKRSGRPGTVG